MKFNEMPIIVTGHATQRLRERFHLFIPSMYLASEVALRDYVVRLIVKGQEITDWQRSDFYRNKFQSKYGIGMRMVKAGSILFLCRDDNGRLVVTTCVKKPPK